MEFSTLNEFFQPSIEGGVFHITNYRFSPINVCTLPGKSFIGETKGGQHSVINTDDKQSKAQDHIQNCFSHSLVSTNSCLKSHCKTTEAII